VVGVRIVGIDENNGYDGGLFLFKDRTETIGYYQPNFLPPYDTPEKRKVISDILSSRWDEEQNTFVPRF
jgi:hypothetical protein